MAILGDILNNLLNLNEDDSSGSGKPQHGTGGHGEHHSH